MVITRQLFIEMNPSNDIEPPSPVSFSHSLCHFFSLFIVCEHERVFVSVLFELNKHFVAHDRCILHNGVDDTIDNPVRALVSSSLNLLNAMIYVY